jgi:hypothetical protein
VAIESYKLLSFSASPRHHCPSARQPAVERVDDGPVIPEGTYDRITDLRSLATLTFEQSFVEKAGVFAILALESETGGPPPLTASTTSTPRRDA